MLRALGILLPVALASVSCVEPRLAAGRLGNVTHASLVPNEARLEPQRQCGDGSLTEAGRQRIVRAPYLQRVTERSALVLFTVRYGAVVVDVSTPRGVMVASVVAGGDGAGDGKSVRQQVARLAGLEPAMIYC